MVTVDFTITNCLKDHVDVIEGYRTAYSSLTKLEPGESINIRYDMSSTYRMYQIVGPGGRRELLNSDDVIENDLIKVVVTTNERGEEGWGVELFKRLSNAQLKRGNSHHGDHSWLNKILGRH